ncbi:MAG: hypothetical protein ACXV74_05145 [Methylobacter sp.]
MMVDIVNAVPAILTPAEVQQLIAFLVDSVTGSMARKCRIQIDDNHQTAANTGAGV